MNYQKKNIIRSGEFLSILLSFVMYMEDTRLPTYITKLLGWLGQPPRGASWETLQYPSNNWSRLRPKIKPSLN